MRWRASPLEARLWGVGEVVSGERDFCFFMSLLRFEVFWVFSGERLSGLTAGDIFPEFFFAALLAFLDYSSTLRSNSADFFVTVLLCCSCCSLFISNSDCIFFIFCLSLYSIVEVSFDWLASRAKICLFFASRNVSNLSI